MSDFEDQVRQQQRWLETYKDEIVAAFGLDPTAKYWYYGLSIYDTYEEALEDNRMLGSPSLQYSAMKEIGGKWIRLD